METLAAMDVLSRLLSHKKLPITLVNSADIEQYKEVNNSEILVQSRRTAYLGTSRK